MRDRVIGRALADLLFLAGVVLALASAVPAFAHREYGTLAVTAVGLGALGRFLRPSAGSRLAASLLSMALALAVCQAPIDTAADLNIHEGAVRVEWLAGIAAILGAITRRHQTNMNRPLPARRSPPRRNERRLACLLLCASLLVFAFTLIPIFRQDTLDRHLLDAICQGNVSESRRLLDGGADPDARSTHPTELLRQNSRLRPLLGGDPDGEGAGAPTALMLATLTGKPELLRMLLARGASINATAAEATPLAWAIAAGSPECVAFLLDHGAQATASCLNQAARTGQVTVVPVLLDRMERAGLRPDKSGALYLAARDGQAAVVRLLAMRGADLRSFVGDTALVETARKGDLAMVRTLLECGANPCARDESGETALEAAHRKRHVAIVRLLRGANRQRECLQFRM